MKAVGIGAIVLWTSRLNEMVAFYKAIGLPLEEEDHGEGPLHFACELGATHFAIFEAKQGDAVSRGTGGCTMIGLQVSNVDEAYAIAKSLGAATVWEPRDMPWGRAAQVLDPDGRPVELNPAPSRDRPSPNF